MNIIGNPFAQYEKSHHVDGEEFVEGMVVNERGEALEKIGAYWYTKEEAALERQSRHDYCQALRDERAASAQRAADQRKADEESFKWLMRGNPGAAYGFDEPTSAPVVKVYRDENALGDVATSLMGWVFFLIIFVGCLIGIMSSL